MTKSLWSLQCVHDARADSWARLHLFPSSSIISQCNHIVQIIEQKLQSIISSLTLQALAGLINCTKGKLFGQFLPNKYISVFRCTVPEVGAYDAEFDNFLVLCGRPPGRTAATIMIPQSPFHSYHPINSQ